jgi:hypothetical protein
LKKVKRRLLTAYYSANKPKNPKYPNEMKRRLRAAFPLVARMLSELKRKDHARAAHLMQNYESAVFVKRICGRIVTERPGVLLVTKHDSILTTPDHVDYLRGMILDEFAALGVNPTLKVESYAGGE